MLYNKIPNIAKMAAVVGSCLVLCGDVQRELFLLRDGGNTYLAAALQIGTPAMQFYALRAQVELMNQRIGSLLAEVEGVQQEIGRAQTDAAERRRERDARRSAFLKIITRADSEFEKDLRRNTLSRPRRGFIDVIRQVWNAKSLIKCRIDIESLLHAKGLDIQINSVGGVREIFSNKRISDASHGFLKDLKGILEEALKEVEAFVDALEELEKRETAIKNKQDEYRRAKKKIHPEVEGLTRQRDALLAQVTSLEKQLDAATVGQKGSFIDVRATAEKEAERIIASAQELMADDAKLRRELRQWILSPAEPVGDPIDILASVVALELGWDPWAASVVQQVRNSLQVNHDLMDRYITKCFNEKPVINQFTVTGSEGKKHKVFYFGAPTADTLLSKQIDEQIATWATRLEYFLRMTDTERDQLIVAEFSSIFEMRSGEQTLLFEFKDSSFIIVHITNSRGGFKDKLRSYANREKGTEGLLRPVTFTARTHYLREDYSVIDAAI